MTHKGSGTRPATRHSRPEVGPAGAGTAAGTARSRPPAGVVPGGRPVAHSVTAAASGPAANGQPEVPASDDAAGAAAQQDDPLDTGPAGLGMFDIGSIPASVTPPRSWRRAAWFTVVASVAALAGLLTVAGVLINPSHDRTEQLAMPYFPDGTPLASIGGSTDVRQPPAGGARRTSASNAAPDVAEMADSTPLAGDGDGTAPGPTGSHGTTPPAPSNPVVVTLPPTDPTTAGGEPVVDPAKLIRRTQTFFAEVTSNAKAAADLTAGTVHDDAMAVIQQKYGDVSAIQVRSISLDPNSGLTISVLRVVNKNGTTATQRTTLQFTLTGDPKILNPGG